ncbi:hypothetical protein CYMTET_35127 [Cymbomonas tetramitiformis]|uniref:tRNA/rRNA methyltransferase SpoU type domain-containing protein n=1 Tax=Cymbomonas tetramitiformis TaxID=36881 RepID=A0AAE0F9R2_9CHLO|nr:hypothetical protein CYMTET_35127 [Cymbomonas tetramitiformis]
MLSGIRRGDCAYRAAVQYRRQVKQGLNDHGNIAGVCRTADALGFQAVHVIGGENGKSYSKSPRGSAGSEKWMDVMTWTSTSACLEALIQNGYRILLAAAPSAAHTVVGQSIAFPDSPLRETAIPLEAAEVDWTCATAVVVGNRPDETGVSRNAQLLAHGCLSVPMLGVGESYNMPIAAALILFQAAQARIEVLGSNGDFSQEEKNIFIAHVCLLQYSSRGAWRKDSYSNRDSFGGILKDSHLPQ